MFRLVTRVLFALALTMQVIAPMASAVAASRDIASAGGRETCLNTAAVDHGQGLPADHHRHRHHDCALCKAFCDGAAPIAAPPASLCAAGLDWRVAPWGARDGALSPPAHPSAHRARAPPQLS